MPIVGSPKFTLLTWTFKIQSAVCALAVCVIVVVDNAGTAAKERTTMSVLIRSFVVINISYR